MAEKKKTRATPLLDELEKGPWPSFVKEFKTLQEKKEVVDDLKKLGKIKKTERIHHTVGVCYRDKGLIEPILSKQWFIKMDSLAKSVLKTINKGKVKIVSKRYEKIARHWLRNLKDWNISRQIVWGMRIPAWRCDKCLKWTITSGKKPKKCPFHSHPGMASCHKGLALKFLQFFSLGFLLLTHLDNIRRHLIPFCSWLLLYQ